MRNKLCEDTKLILTFRVDARHFILVIVSRLIGKLIPGRR